jgi:hypothetical protein
MAAYGPHNAHELIGTTFRGFCSGFFGRDDWSPKTVEGIGPDWLVARHESGDAPVLVHFGPEWRDHMWNLINQWVDEPPPDGF